MSRPSPSGLGQLSRIPPAARRARRTRPSRPRLEPLEDRTVLSLTFPAEYGAQPTTNGGDVRTGNIPVYLIFAGGSTTGFGSDGSLDMNTIVNAVKNILNSPFYSGLSEYHASTSAYVAGTYVSHYNLPKTFNDNGNNGDINNVVSDSINDNNGTLPEVDDTDEDGVYMVFTPQGYALGSGALGHHSHGNTGGFLDPDDAQDGVVTSTIQAVPNPAPTANQSPSTVNFVPLTPLDTMTETFSHELGEILTNPEDNGVQTTPPASFTYSSVENPGEIGDNEGEFYVGFENGTMVQSYWSAAGGDYIIPGGTAQRVSTSGGTLTIKGDSLAVTDDTLTITTASGGVQVTLDGESETYGAGQITHIDVSLGGGTNDVHVAGLPAGVTVNIDGSGGTTTVTGTDGANTWDITGPGSGTLNTVVTFSSVQNLAGGLAPDSFQFEPAGSIPGNIDGGGGVNGLSFTTRSTAVSVNLQADTATDIGGTFSSITDFFGGTGSNTFTGPDASNTWIIPSLNLGFVAGTLFSGFGNLVGGSSIDNFEFLPGGSVSGNVDGGGAINSLDYRALFTPVTVNLQADTATGIGGTFADVTQFFGGTGANTIDGPDAATTWSIFGADFEQLDGSTFFSFGNLIGGTGLDQFAFQPGGSLSGNVDGGGGTNTLDDSGSSSPVTVNLQSDTATGIGGTFANVTNFLGSPGSDTFIGHDAPAVWSITGPGAGSVAGSTFSSFENLTGGLATDTFAFQPGGSVGGNVDGGGGFNTLDYSALATPVTVNLQAMTATGIGGTFANIAKFIGGTASDTLIGPDVPSVWSVTGASAGTVGAATFSSFENLTGGSASDQFVFQPGGSVGGNIDGGGASNALDYSAISTPVTLNLAAMTSTGIGGTFTNINNFIGGSGINTVVGPNGPTTYTITGPNTIMVVGLNISGFQSVTGGPSGDTFAFQTGGSLSGSIDGGGGVNTLDYSGFVGDLNVNLSLSTATAVGQGIANIQNVTGSRGNDLIVGSTQPNTLIGGTGRNIVIGGGGTDAITGGGGDNILIAGTTAYDLIPAALDALVAEWTRTDVSFEKRVSDLMTGNKGSLNGQYTLDKKSVVSDDSPDVVTGGGGLDWFFVTNFDDTVENRKPQDHITLTK